MKIETKFNIGDKVYTVDLYEDEWYPNKEAFLITEIIVRKFRSEFGIVYCLLGNEYEVKAAETFCFKTYEECKQWCEGERQ